MLGAQALRTKQKIEDKERAKRQKERQRNLEVQRERIQKAASEDAQAAMLEFAAQQAALNSLSSGHHQNQHHHSSHSTTAKPHQRHSLHTTVLNDHIMPLSAREISHLESSHERLPPRSPSTDCGKGGHESGGNRILRWFGLASNSQKKQQQKRRMSTF